MRPLIVLSDPLSNDSPLAEQSMNVVDRKSRDIVAAEVRRYLDGETTAFAFDDAIFDVESKDPTVNDIVRRLWCHYDDCKDHHVLLSKPEWDYFQRLLLILESDRHIASSKVTRRWQLTQLIAFLALALFMLVVWRFGIGRHLLLFAAPFGVISMLISYWRRATTATDNAAVSLMPFSSFTEIRDTYRSVQHFRKAKYPNDMPDLRIRSDVMHAVMMMPTVIAWLAFAPLVLLFQMLPERHSESRVVCVS